MKGYRFHESVGTRGFEPVPPGPKQDRIIIIIDSMNYSD